jgi:hypothetical protein
MAVAGTQPFWSSKYLLLVNVAVGEAVYLGALRALKALNEDDFELVRSLVPTGAHVLVNSAVKVLTWNG